MSTFRYMFIVVLLSQSSLMGQNVVVDDNLIFSPALSTIQMGEINYVGKIYQDVARADPTFAYFQYERFGFLSSGGLEAISLTLDEGSDWYLVQQGDMFTAATIASGQFQPILTTGNPRPPVTVLDIFDTDFYLGVSTSSTMGGGSGSFSDRDVFGWVRLIQSGADVQLLDFGGSAVAYGAQGIVVGTTTAVVPEPTSVQLISTLVLGTVCRRRRT